MQDINGNSVLHYMVVYSSPLEQIELILKMAPQSVSLPNASGKTPMNTAYQHKMSSRCLSLLDSLSHQKKNFVREHGLKPSETAIKYDKKFLFEKEEVFWSDLLFILQKWSLFILISKFSVCNRRSKFHANWSNQGHEEFFSIISSDWRCPLSDRTIIIRCQNWKAFSMIWSAKMWCCERIFDLDIFLRIGESCL